MLALRQLDFRASIPPQKLRVPHGESACLVLDFLTEKALNSIRFKWSKPVYNDPQQVITFFIELIFLVFM